VYANYSKNIEYNRELH